MIKKNVYADPLHKSLVQEFMNKHPKCIGIDEVGRGALAGPIIVCGVGLRENFSHLLITDSKLLTRRQRHQAKDIIREQYSYLQFEEITPRVINERKLNLNKLIIEAIMKILDDAAERGITGALIDWLEVYHEKVETISLPRMELLSTPTAAASIMAKIQRDEIMTNYDEAYPNYKFKKNVGYGTEEHREAIRKYGICKVHREYFCKKALLKGEE